MTAAFLAAFGLLTRLPVRRAFKPGDVARAATFFPVVGAVVGGSQVLAWWLCARLASPVLAVCLVALGVALTGAMHLDGLADMADGFGGGRSRADVLRIMRDPVVGSYGAIAIVLVLLVKVLCLSAMADRRLVAAPLLVAPILSRWSMAVAGRWLPSARPQGSGLGAVLHDPAARHAWIPATLIAGVLGWFASGAYLLIWWTVTATVTLVVGWWSHRRIGGFTGDTLGATAELSEAVVWIVAVAIAP